MGNDTSLHLIFHQKNMVVEFFSGSDKTLKVAKNYDLGFVGWLFFVVVRSHQQPMHGCNLESSLLSNLFIRKYFIVQMFRKWRKNLLNTIFLIQNPGPIPHKTVPDIKKTLSHNIKHCFILQKKYSTLNNTVPYSKTLFYTMQHYFMRHKTVPYWTRLFHMKKKTLFHPAQHSSIQDPG